MYEGQEEEIKQLTAILLDNAMEHTEKGKHYHMKRIVLASVMYFLITSVCLLVFGNMIDNIYNWILLVGAVYMAGCILYNLTLRKSLMFKNLILNVKRVIAISMIIVIVATYRVMSVSKDTKALKACYKLIKHTNPDLVIVTGDLVFPMGIMSFSINNNAPIMQFANFMRNTGIPWAFTYGNHDTESMATLNVNEFDSLMKSISYKNSKNLLYPYILGK